MALVVSKQTFARFGGMNNLLKPLNSSGWICPIQIATLRATYGEKYPYEKPYPYEKKKFNIIREFFDNTKSRLNENSKVIVVDGNLAVGKNDFARRLARNFDLKVFESVRDNTCFQDKENGFDVRCLDDILPEEYKFYDLKRWLSDPNPASGKVGRLQMRWYQEKFEVYRKALLHMLSTGQGVVVVRPPFSDLTLVEAMRKCGYVTRHYVKFHKALQENSACDLLKPHLTIYLDAPVNVIMDRIKARHNPDEINSNIITDKYVSAIENQYKQSYLPTMKKSGEVLELDWTEVADNDDMEVVAEEIEHIQMSTTDPEDSRFKDWWELSEDELCLMRKKFGSEFWQYTMIQRPWPIDCPEVTLSLDNINLYNEVVNKHPALKYKTGWAPELGDKTAFKLF